MALESISREFEVFMREMMKTQECAHENIESELRGLIRTTVNSCATLYGFSAKEALAKLDSNGNILPQIPNQEAQKRLKELEKAEKVRMKEFQKAQKAEIKEFEKTEAIRRKEFEKAKKNKLKEAERAEKANELSERNKMKQQDIASKAINQKKKKTTVTKKVQDEEIHILFQAVPLIEEINSIRNIKVQKRLSAGVKLARQILDI